MNTNVFFARHGTVKNPEGKIYRPDAELSDDGFKQMGLLGEAFAQQGIKIDVIVTSPLPRAMQSAAKIRDKLRVHPTAIPLEGLRATDTPGWYGHSFDELDTLDKETHKDIWSIQDWCAETMEQVDLRLKRAFDEILRDHEGKNILIIGHNPELGLLQNRLENPEGPSKIASFPAEKGKAWHVEIDEEGRMKPLGIIGPENISVDKEFA